ncbi:putative ZDHHC-type palmitoyltransferase 8 [Haliotis asinina]|uniref:putative ZDHHC-type palmitoyltransferase 8 n=1 Tax=Haliotis asinina TaxID=109174 RepID=UPI0035319D5E
MPTSSSSQGDLYDPATDRRADVNRQTATADHRKMEAREKCKKSHESKGNSGYISSKLSRLSFHVFINTIAPFVFFIVFSGVFYWGVTEALPFLYSECDVVYLILNQILACVISFEMMINWFCIRYVDSHYNPFLHGTKPESKTGTGPGKQGDDQHITDLRGSEEDINSNMTKSGGATKRKKVYRMFVATSLPDKNGHCDRQSYDYWSWSPCVVCRRPRPPRCHHCVLCNRCVLKRDHHCFFAGSCVGINNQRHFIVFLFWTFFGCFYAFMHMAPYAYMEVLPNIAYIDLVPPVSLVRALLGYQHYLISFLTFLGWSLTYFVVLSGTHLVDSFSILLTSQTTFEHANDIDVTDFRTNQERIRGVFGDNWLLNFIFPCHRLFKQTDDPVLWSSISM